MNKLKIFIRTSLLGGLVVILPAAILIFAAKWIFTVVTSLIQPLTNILLNYFQLPEIFADLIVIAVILAACFFVGIFVRTKLGTWIFNTVENKILSVAPGYNLIKETVLQFIGNKKPPFSSVALAQVYQNDTLVTAFVTDTHADGTYTVFVPTGPNPTSGNIFHLQGKYVHLVDVPVETAMRTIISCGAGSTKIIQAYNQKINV